MSKKTKREKYPEQEEPKAPSEESGEAKGLQEEKPDLLDRLKRLGADYQNYQKRAQRDMAQAREFANEELIKSLLSVLDDMERALAAARENHADDDPLLMGMQLVHDKTLETLGKFGLAAIEAAGKPFDPDRHLAVLQQPSDLLPPQTVLDELQKGYTLKGRTLRPASVVVSKAPDEDESVDNDQADKQ